MNSDMWMLIAMIEFVIIVIYIGPSVVLALTRKSKMPTSTQLKKGDIPRQGVITKTMLSARGVMSNPITLFEIKPLFEISHTGNDIVLAGIDGWETGLKEGDRIEYWLSEKRIAYDTKPLKSEKNGVVSLSSKEVDYFGIEKYRLLNNNLADSHQELAIQ